MAFEKKQNNNDKNIAALRAMPNNLEAEQAVLGAIISDSQIANDVVCNLSIDDFYSQVNQIVFAEIKELNKASKPIDIIMLSAKLSQTDNVPKDSGIRLAKANDGVSLLEQIGGISMLTDLVQSIASTANFDYYVKILKQKSLLRSIIRRCNQIIANAYEVEDAEKVLAVAESLIYNISESKDTSTLAHITETSVEVLARINQEYTHNASSNSLKVGFENLDEMTSGFVGGQLIILAARPGCGKTSFAMNIVANIARDQPQKVVAVFNLEMSASELVGRMFSNIAKIDGELLKDGSNLNSSHLDLIWKADALLHNSNIYIDDTALITAEQIMSKCRRLKAQKGALDLVVVDYLQLMDSTNPMASKQQQVSDTSRAFKVLAKELKVPIIVLSQMSRDIENREKLKLDATPKLSDLRESGAIEQDADIVFFLSKGDFELFGKEGEAIYLLVAKQRNGSTGQLAFAWNKGLADYTPIRNIVVKAKGEEKVGNDEEGNKQTASSQNSADSKNESGQRNGNGGQSGDIPFNADGDGGESYVQYNAEGAEGGNFEDDLLTNAQPAASSKAVTNKQAEFNAGGNVPEAYADLDNVSEANVMPKNINELDDPLKELQGDKICTKPTTVEEE